MTKADAIREKLRSSPGWSNRRIAEWLSSRGVEVKPQRVADIRYEMRKRRESELSESISGKDLAKVERFARSLGGLERLLAACRLLIEQ